jgi:hypothetical protein
MLDNATNWGEMGVEKGGSKGSGFFHLFDWNRKSRKKLFTVSPGTILVYLIIYLKSLMQNLTIEFLFFSSCCFII